jgi:hypothetical protein
VEVWEFCCRSRVWLLYLVCPLGGLGSNTFWLLKTFVWSPLALPLNDTSCQRSHKIAGFWPGFVCLEAENMLSDHLQYLFLSFPDTCSIFPPAM